MIGQQKLKSKVFVKALRHWCDTMREHILSNYYNQLSEEEINIVIEALNFYKSSCDIFIVFHKGLFEDFKEAEENKLMADEILKEVREMYGRTAEVNSEAK